MSYKVYMLTCSVSGKSYIGMTKQKVSARWLMHRIEARKGSRKAFHCAIRTHGPDSFTLEILHEIETAEEAKRLEILEIEQRNTYGRGGYNATRGGDGALDLTPEARAKISAFHRVRKKTVEEIAKRAGEFQVQAKRYVVTHPDGREEEILNLTAFCRRQGLDHRKAHETTYDASRTHKGYRFREAGTPPRAVQKRPLGAKLTPEQRVDLAQRALAGASALTPTKRAQGSAFSAALA